MAIEIGRLAVKIAGRDAGKECLIVEDLGNNLVLIDGNTRRRKCNILHLELLTKKGDIKKSASHDEVISALKKLKVKIIPRAPPRKKEKKEEKKEEKKGLFGLKKKEKPKEKKKPAKKTKKKAKK